MASSPLALPSSPSKLPIPAFLTTVFRPQSSGAADIAGYIQPQRPAETAIRKLVGQPNNGGTIGGATAEQRLDRDLVNLSDRADKVLAQYGNDQRLANIRRSLNTQVDAKYLASVGRGPAEQVRGPSTATTERVLTNGTSRFTTVDLQSQTINRFQVTDAQGLAGGQQTVQTIRTVTEAGGNDVNSGKALASVSRFEDTVQTVATDVRDGTRKETFAQSAIITRSDTTDIRAETTLRAVVTRKFENENGRFIEQVTREDFQSVTTLADQSTVVAASERRSLTRQLVNLDTGEVSTTVETSVVNASVKTSTTGEGANAVTNQTISVSANQNSTRIRAGGPDDKTTVQERVNAESSTIQRSTRGDQTTERVRTAASQTVNRFTGTDQTVLGASQSITSAATSIDSKGTVSATAQQRSTQFKLTETGRLVDDGFDPTAPFNQIPETTVRSAASLSRTVSASITADGTTRVAAREESVGSKPVDRKDPTAGAIQTPVKESTLTGTIPAAVANAAPAPQASPGASKGKSENESNKNGGGKSESEPKNKKEVANLAPVLETSTTTPRGRLEIEPIKNSGGKFEVQAENKRGQGPSIIVDRANRTLTAEGRGTPSGPTSTASAETGLLLARGVGANAGGARTASGALTDDGATIEARSSGKAFLRPLALKANDLGELFRASRSGPFEAVKPLPQATLTFVAPPPLRLSV